MKLKLWLQQNEGSGGFSGQRSNDFAQNDGGNRNADGYNRSKPSTFSFFEEKKSSPLIAKKNVPHRGRTQKNKC